MLHGIRSGNVKSLHSSFNQGIKLHACRMMSTLNFIKTFSGAVCVCGMLPLFAQHNLIGSLHSYLTLDFHGKEIVLTNDKKWQEC